MSAGTVLWFLALGLGFHNILAWEATPGPGSQKRPALELAKGRPALVVVLHSMCPCSLGTVANLHYLTPAQSRKIDVTLVVTGPHCRTSAVAVQACLVPRAHIRFLTEGQVIAKYGALTSGQAYLFDQSGALVFAGGLTDSRGCQGQSRGMKAVTDTIAGKPCVKALPVFGCPVRTPRRLA